MAKTKAEIQQENDALKARLDAQDAVLAEMQERLNASRGDAPTFEVRVNTGAERSYGVVSISKKGANGVYLKGGTIGVRTKADVVKIRDDLTAAIELL